MFNSKYIFLMSGQVEEMHCEIWMFSPPGLDIVII